MDWERRLREFRSQNWVILMILGCASFFLMSSNFTLGIILGGFMIIASFTLLQRAVVCGVSSQGVMGASKRVIMLKCYFRLAIVGIIIYILLTKQWVNPIGLAIGLSTVVISIISTGIRAVLKTFFSASSDQTI
ncbi:MAG: ATP synthase subunit I [Thermodesulfobacteriota bacterium]|nr:ATP synthase subunit I [Thermodesulfobacteriota bacterium]